MVNIIVGVILIILGLSGRVAIIGTRSPALLIVVGGAVLALGIFQTIRRSQRRQQQQQQGDDD